MDLDGLGIELQAVLVDEELLNIFTLITLELNHLSHLRIDDNSAIASKFLLDDLQDLLWIISLWKTLDSSQRLTTIALLDTDMDVVLRLFDVIYIFADFSEGIEGLEIFDGAGMSLVDNVLLALGLYRIICTGFRHFAVGGAVDGLRVCT